MTREEWAIVSRRDPAYDGRLFCGTTRSMTVCRISCPRYSRSIGNVKIFHSLDEAVHDGFTPCSQCRPDGSRKRDAGQDLIERTRDYMEKHSAEKFSLQQLSKALFVNGSYLLRVFHRRTGMTLLEYHNHVRCENAKSLLEHGECSISKVGEQVGFASSAHFSRIFKRDTGVTPTQWRDRHFAGEDDEGKENPDEP